MTEENNTADEKEEFEVVILGVDNGDDEEGVEGEEDDGEAFVIISRMTYEEKTYAVMMLLEDAENMESMSKEEFEEFYGEESPCMVMRQEGDAYMEPSDEEYESIRESLQTHLSEQEQ